MISKRRWLIMCSTTLAVMVLFFSWSMAQDDTKDAKTDAQTPEVKKDEAPPEKVDAKVEDKKPEDKKPEEKKPDEKKPEYAGYQSGQSKEDPIGGGVGADAVPA